MSTTPASSIFRAACDFPAPLRFGDTAKIELTVARLGTQPITFHYRVYRVDERDRTLCAEGQVVCAVILARFVAVAVPERVLAILGDLVEALA